MSWKSVKLSDVCEINIGKTPSRNNPEYWGEGNPWLSIADMKQGHELFFTKEQITDMAVIESNIKLVPEGTVLFSFKLSIGKIGITKIAMYTNEAIAALPIKNRKILSKEYLVYALTKINFSKLVDRAAMGKTLNKNKLANLLIPLPPLKEQKQIAATLDKADAIRRKRQQAIDLTNQLLRSVFLDMFGDPVTNPMGWEVKKLGELTKISSGSTPNRKEAGYYGGTIPWVKTTEVNSKVITSTLEYITEEGLNNSSCKLYPKNSIIIAMYGQGKTRGQVGILGLDATTNQACAVLPPTDKFSTYYVYSLLKNSYENLRSLGQGGNQPNLNAGIIKNYEITLPPLDLQNKFAEIFKKTEAMKTKLQESFDQLNDNFNALSQKSF